MKTGKYYSRFLFAIDEKLTAKLLYGMLKIGGLTHIKLDLCCYFAYYFINEKLII